MGNKWGVIHNQSNQDIVYVLHTNDIDPFKKVIEQYKDIDTDKQRLDHSEEGDFKTLLQQSALKQPCSYNLPAGKIGSAGLNNINFSKFNCISVVTASGKLVMDKVKIVSQQDLRFRIREDKFQVRKLSSQQSQKLKSFAMGGTIRGGYCHRCKQGKATFRQVDEQQKCKRCNNKNKQLWVCVKNPVTHHFCQDCHTAGNLQRQLAEKNVL